MTEHQASILLRAKMVRSNRSMKLRDAAKLLDVDVQTIRRWIRKGALRAHKLPGGHYRVTESAIRECQGSAV